MKRQAIAAFAMLALLIGCSEPPELESEQETPAEAPAIDHELPGETANEDEADEAPIDVRLRYRDPAGFSIEFPRDWERRVGYAGTNVTALRPPGGPAELFREHVNVVVERLPRGTDLESYLRSSVANMAMLLDDMRLVDDERLDLAGRRAALLVYEANMGALELRNLLYVVFDGDRAFNITCSMLPETFEDYAPMMREVVASFRIE